MNKILELLVYKSNRWYDNLEELPRFLFFLGVIVAPIGITNALLILYGLWQPFAVFVILVLFWRMTYFTRKPKKISFDIETNGLMGKQYNTQGFDYTHIQKKIDGMGDAGKPEIIDTFQIFKEILKKK
jgi:hypothetical protein